MNQAGSWHSHFLVNHPTENLLDAVTLEVLPQRNAAGLCDEQGSVEGPRER